MNAEGCAICGAALQRGVFDTQDATTGERFSIDVCSDCGHGMTRPVPADLSPYYPAEYYGGRHGLTDRYCAARRVRWLERASAPGRLLDLGCGDGAFLSAARAEGYEPFGVEVGRARELAQASGLPVFARSNEAAAHGPFSVVTTWHSLEHFSDPAAELHTAHELLDRNGRLIVAVPDFGGLQARLYRGAWLHLDAPRHLHHFTERSMGRLLASCGFRAIETFHQELEYDVFGWIQSTENLVPARRNRAFERLRGGASASSPLELAASVLFVAATGPAAVALTALSTLARRGGTLVVIAERR